MKNDLSFMCEKYGLILDIIGKCITNKKGAIKYRDKVIKILNESLNTNLTKEQIESPFRYLCDNTVLDSYAYEQIRSGNVSVLNTLIQNGVCNMESLMESFNFNDPQKTNEREFTLLVSFYIFMLNSFIENNNN